jgi:hypothetical protein
MAFTPSAIRLLRALMIVVATLFFAENGSAVEVKTISRTEDPVVVTGKNIAPLLGADPARLSLLTFLDGKFSPVPFQIDQRKKNSEYAFMSGPNASSDEDPNLDANDELVFMANDLGDSAPSGQFPAGAEVGVELTISDPTTGNKGWVYLFRFAEKAPRSKHDYVRAEISKAENRKRVDTIDTTGKGVRMAAPLDRFYPDELRMTYPDGRVTPDVLDRLKIRGEMESRVLLRFDFVLDELIKDKVLAWTDGPVRVLYRSEGYFDVGPFKISAREQSLVKYYRNAFVSSFELELPIQPNSVLKSFPLKGYLDFNENILGSQIYSGSNRPDPNVVLDGKQSEAEKALDTKTHTDWIIGHGPMGGIVCRLFFSDEWSSVKTRFYMHENISESAGPESDRGELAVGFDCIDLEKVTSKKGSLEVEFYLLHDFKPGDEKPIVAIRDQPLQFRVKQIQAAASN